MLFVAFDFLRQYFNLIALAGKRPQKKIEVHPTFWDRSKASKPLALITNRTSRLSKTCLYRAVLD